MAVDVQTEIVIDLPRERVAEYGFFDVLGAHVTPDRRASRRRSCRGPGSSAVA